jgi:hypothetical protein
MAGQPTKWATNPTASTANVVEYDSTTRKYDVHTQPYDGYNIGIRPFNWKNPSAWQNSLAFPAQQQYYGGPSFVPLYGGPTHWQANPGIVNQAGQYVPSVGAEADLYAYDGIGPASQSYANSTISYGSSTVTYEGFVESLMPYDSGTRNYDGTNNGESFYSWKKPTGWTVVAGSEGF